MLMSLPSFTPDVLTSISAFFRALFEAFLSTSSLISPSSFSVKAISTLGFALDVDITLNTSESFYISKSKATFNECSTS